MEVRAFWPVTLHGKTEPALNLRYSRSPDVGEERVNFIKQNVGLVAKSTGCTEHFAGGCSCRGRCRTDTGDVARHLASSAHGVFNVARDFVRRSALLIDRGGNRSGHDVDLANSVTDVSDSADRR